MIATLSEQWVFFASGVLLGIAIAFVFAPLIWYHAVKITFFRIKKEIESEDILDIDNQQSEDKNRL